MRWPIGSFLSLVFFLSWFPVTDVINHISLDQMEFRVYLNWFFLIIIWIQSLTWLVNYYKSINDWYCHCGLQKRRLEPDCDECTVSWRSWQRILNPSRTALSCVTNSGNVFVLGCSCFYLAIRLVPQNSPFGRWLLKIRRSVCGLSNNLCTLWVALYSGKSAELGVRQSGFEFWPRPYLAVWPGQVSTSWTLLSTPVNHLSYLLYLIIRKVLCSS